MVFDLLLAKDRLSSVEETVFKSKIPFMNDDMLWSAFNIFDTNFVFNVGEVEFCILTLLVLILLNSFTKVLLCTSSVIFAAWVYL